MKNFYQEIRKLVQKYAPQAKFVFHDAFQKDPSIWNDMFNDTDKVVMDTHFYVAWDVATRSVDGFCKQY